MYYREIVNCFNLQKGDKIWLSSEMIKYASFFKMKNERIDLMKLIEAFQDSIGEEGTMILPTFSFEFSNKGRYDYLHTKGSTGALSNKAMSRVDFRRTRHPMHSFVVWGKDKDYLCSLQNSNSFGADSPFEYCVREQVKQIILGTDYVHAFTFVHYVENICNVPYRFNKTFSGEYIDENGIASTREFDYPARKLEICPEERFNRIGKILEKKGISKQIEIEGIENYIIDLASSYNVIYDDIKNNMCRNIYDFNISRELVFQ